MNGYTFSGWHAEIHGPDHAEPSLMALVAHADHITALHVMI
jgi:hypothetical protein